MIKFYYFFGGLLTWIIFSFDLEYDRDVMTWMWLLLSLLFFGRFYIDNYHSKPTPNTKKPTTVDCDYKWHNREIIKWSYCGKCGDNKLK